MEDPNWFGHYICILFAGLYDIIQSDILGSGSYGFNISSYVSNTVPGTTSTWMTKNQSKVLDLDKVNTVIYYKPV